MVRALFKKKKKFSEDRTNVKATYGPLFRHKTIPYMIKRHTSLVTLSLLAEIMRFSPMYGRYRRQVKNLFQKIPPYHTHSKQTHFLYILYSVHTYMLIYNIYVIYCIWYHSILQCGRFLSDSICNIYLMLLTKCIPPYVLQKEKKKKT